MAGHSQIGEYVGSLAQSQGVPSSLGLISMSE